MSFTRNFNSLPKTFRVSLPANVDGWLGRECPQDECKRYFKITPGTGLKDINTCRCPYCGHEGSNDAFHTQAQVDYVRSIAENMAIGALLKDMKSLEHRYRGPGLSVAVRGRPPAIRGYSEQDLETEIVCDACTLRYAIYGVFGFCPDCGSHNNLNVLDANLRLLMKMLALAETADADVAKSLVESALKDCVSAFDGWGRAVCQTFADKSTNPIHAGKISFQNIKRAHEAVKTLFNFDAEAVVGAEALAALHRAFQKRHLLAHRMGVIDDDYLRQAGDVSAQKGHRIIVTASETEDMARGIRAWAEALNTHLEKLS